MTLYVCHYSNLCMENYQFVNNINELMFDAIVTLSLHSVSMKDVIYLLLHLLTAITKLVKPGGSRAVIAENLLLKQQLITHSRSRKRSPKLTANDRTVLGLLSMFLIPRRPARSAIITKPSSLLAFHKALKKPKYRLLYSPCGGRKPGPKGPSSEVIRAIVENETAQPSIWLPSFRPADQPGVRTGPG